VSRVLFLDPVGGIAGDMLCAALIELGADLASIQGALEGLAIPGLSVSTQAVQRGPFAATQFLVQCDTEDHPHRTWATIRAMLEGSALTPGAKTRSLAVFERIARAEAEVHGCEIDEVHFHEVGAWDSIADIVGASVALDSLDVTQIIANPPPLSTGTIQSSHGTMPLPAPATLKLLEGWPVRSGPVGRECTTPTGAAFLAALAQPGSLPSMTIEGTGTGAGSRDPADLPNVLRATMGRSAQASSPRSIEVLEAQMDDLTGEHLPPLIDALLAAGAVDAYATAVLMKKGRTGLLITALATPEHSDGVAEAMLRHGSTFGVRRCSAERTVLDRWFDSAETPWGTVRIKIGALNGEVLHAAPEYEDVLRIATEAKQAVPQVHAAALAAWRNDQTS
jgi:uncharacterized protein (TIGR00299 family) protein